MNDWVQVTAVLILWIVLNLLFYGTISYVFLEPNPFDWHPIIRIAQSVFVVVSAAGAITALVEGNG